MQKLTAVEIVEVQAQMAKSQGISPERWNALLVERQGMIDRARLASIGVVI